MPDRWFAKSISQTQTPTGYIIVLTTDVPCHLTLYWTDKKPWTHDTVRNERGLLVPWDTYWCFVLWHLIPQEEAGDTLIHTYIWDGWLNCYTRYFRFHGTINAVTSPSDSPILTKHFLLTVGTLRPVPPAESTAFGRSGDDQNYKCLDDIEPDEDATYIFGNPPNYIGENYHTTIVPPGRTFPGLTVYARFRTDFPPTRPCVKIGILIYPFGLPQWHASGEFTPGVAYFTFAHTWATNPGTGLPWTSTDINNMHLGLEMRRYTLVPPIWYTRCTQLYATLTA